MDHALHHNAVLMVRLSTQLEVIGDGAVEALTQSPDQTISWNSCLSTRWEAADGGMESNIGFLRQLYALEKMRGEGVTEAIKAELKEATDFYHEAIDSMLGTGLFDIEGTGEFAGKTLSAEYRTLLARHQQLMGQWVYALGSYQAQQAIYEASADQLQLRLVTIESSNSLPSRRAAMPPSRIRWHSSTTSSARPVPCCWVACC
ncbi:MAG: hypothetical protein ACRDCY_17915 [Aeromonas veronii]